MKKYKVYITYRFVRGRPFRCTKVVEQSSDITEEHMKAVVDRLINASYHHEERGKTAKIVLLDNVTSIDIKVKEIRR